MKIFFSHSSFNKPLLREIKKHLPDGIKVWIDEKDLLIGEEVTASLQNVIASEMDFLVIFIDQFAVQSEWVLKELKWALDVSQQTGRSFVLPVVIDEKAFSLLEMPYLKELKRLKCSDFTEIGIKALAESLTSHLYSLLSRDYKATKEKIEGKASLSLLDQAERFLFEVANSIRTCVYPYRREKPLPIAILFELLQAKGSLGGLSENQFHELLIRLQERGLIAGMICDGEEIFVEEEHFAWKTSMFSDSKGKIGRKAGSFIRSGHTIVLDAGSTVLQIAAELKNGLKMRRWKNITVVTNSISVASDLLATASEMGLEDDSSFLKVYIVGGRIRLNTQAIVTDDQLLQHGRLTDFSIILPSLGGVDLAFVGTNGVFRDLGFTTLTASERDTKEAMLHWAKRKFIVTDPSKFGIYQENVFAKFDEGIEIITCREGCAQILTEYEEYFEETSTKIIYA